MERETERGRVGRQKEGVDLREREGERKKNNLTRVLEVFNKIFK
jgi:hypothetical protein